MGFKEFVKFVLLFMAVGPGKPSRAFAMNEVYSIKLNKQDSTEFADGMRGLSEVKKRQDPEYSNLVHAKEWYKSPNGAITISCRHTFVDEEPFSVECEFSFDPSQSSAEAGVRVTKGVLIQATIYDTEVATKIYQNFGMNPYSSNEQVGYVLEGDLRERPRVRMECTPIRIMGDSARQCVIEVVLKSE